MEKLINENKTERELRKFINEEVPEELRDRLWDLIDDYVIYNRDAVEERVREELQ
jgi:hypothetical protein